MFSSLTFLLLTIMVTAIHSHGPDGLINVNSYNQGMPIGKASLKSFIRPFATQMSASWVGYCKRIEAEVRMSVASAMHFN